MTDDLTDDVFDRLSAQLVEAHRRVRSLQVSKDEKARATRRLLAISDAAKHDLKRAAIRLDAFLDDLDQGRIAAADPSDG